MEKKNTNKEIPEENINCSDSCCNEEINKSQDEELDNPNKEEFENEARKEENIEDFKLLIEEKDKQCKEYLDLLRRNMADFDNYRKRTTKEKEGLYDDGFGEAIKTILPVLDNLERAVDFTSEDSKGIIEGVEMVLKIFKDILNSSGVEEIEALGKKFDPDFHNAVFHIEDENLEDNIVVEVLQKGYKYKNKILRYSMVKVAN